jgi:chloride channel 3/4/5
LSTTEFKGFPLVSADADGAKRMLGGYIGRTELLYVLERARKTQDIGPETECVFAAADGERDGDLDNNYFDLGLGLGVAEDFSTELFEGRELKFWPWVNQVRDLFPPC